MVVTSAGADGTAAPAAGPRTVRAAVVVIAVGLFATGLGWPGIIGRLPFSLLLKNQLHLPPQQVAAFWAIATFAWYVKPLVGLVCDAYPLFGTRRRGYLLTGSILAGLLWLAFAVVPRAYLPLMAVMTGLNLALVLVSTAVGATLVETGQRYGATGRLSSLRQAVVGVIGLISGPLAGWLASRPFAWTAAAGALILLAFVPVAAALYPEARGARRNAAVWTTARAQLRQIVRSRPVWAAAALLFLIYLAPGFQTPLLYVQQDVLKLDPQFMGNLQFLSGAGALVGAAAYAYYCRRLSLRATLLLGIAVNVACTLLYVRYDSRLAAAVIDTINGVAYSVAILPPFDLAARAAPRGSEGFAYAILTSVYTIAYFAISDPLGSYLYGSLHVPFASLVFINAGATAAVLLFVPFLPRALMTAREGEGTAAA